MVKPRIQQDSNDTKPAIAVAATNAPKPDFPMEDPILANAPAGTELLPKSPSDEAKMRTTGVPYTSENVNPGVKRT